MYPAEDMRPSVPEPTLVAQPPSAGAQGLGRVLEDRIMHDQAYPVDTPHIRLVVSL